MNAKELTKLGLNTNEAKVYFSLITKKEATAQELIKLLGFHRNIVYDNLEKLIEKGLVSVINEDNKRRFIAQSPDAIIEFLEEKKRKAEEEIDLARELVPSIGTLLSKNPGKQEVSLFRGTGGLKKVLNEVVKAKESWCIGVTNDSVNILGEFFWKQYNARKDQYETKEWLLWNHDYKNTIIAPRKDTRSRILPKEFNQVTETMLWNNKVAILVYTQNPIVILIENKEVFDTHLKQFYFLWERSEKT